MENPHSVRSLIALWPSRTDLAADLTSPADPVTVAQVNKWAQRESIPNVFHARMLRAGQARGFAITAEDFVVAHDVSTPETQPPAEDAA